MTAPLGEDLVEEGGKGVRVGGGWNTRLGPGMAKVMHKMGDFTLEAFVA